VLFSTQERPRAFSVWTTANFIGIPLGPVLGGWLLDHYWWGSVFLINVPVVAVALLALAVLLPESHSLRHPRLDLLGVVTSALGLVGLVYGLTRAGEQGWGDPGALTTMLAGVALLVGFVGWQRRLGRRPGGQPLVDLSLFGSASFTWAMLLFMLVMFALFGMMFTLPQYLQAVLGADALGTGLRLLPTIGGLMVGTQVAERLGRRVGAKATVALGFAVLTAGLLVGATTGVYTGYGTVAAWMSAVGAGVGLVLPTAIGAALGALDAERSGVGSALVGVLRQVGGAFGVAIVGTVLSAAYHSRLDLTGLPTQAADAVRDSAAAGIAVAHQLGSAPLLDSVRAAFVHGMDATLWVCGGIAVAGVVLALAFLPRQGSATATADTNGHTARSGRDVAV
jgi:EmrB/QacA subfamily drug resistance transporter